MKVAPARSAHGRKQKPLRQPDFSRACCDVTVMCWTPVRRRPQIPRTPVLACAAVPDPIEAVAPASQVLRLDPVSLGVPVRAVGSPPSHAGLRPERLLRNPVRPRYSMNRTPMPLVSLMRFQTSPARPTTAIKSKTFSATFLIVDTTPFESGRRVWVSDGRASR